MAVRRPRPVAERTWKGLAAPSLLAFEVEHGLGLTIEDQHGLSSGRRPTDLYDGDSGPAANAGLRGLSQTEDGIELGDIIVGVDGEKVGTNDDLLRVLDKHKLGDTVKVEVVRRGGRTVVPVTLTELPATNRRRGYGE